MNISCDSSPCPYHAHPADIAFVDVHLLHVVAVAGNQGAVPSETAGAVKDFPQLLGWISIASTRRWRLSCFSL